jgi:tripartite-type tricarboxylate transporter receptor subunit TctC
MSHAIACIERIIAVSRLRILGCAVLFEKRSRRQLCNQWALALWAVFFMAYAQAQPWPNKPIKLIVGYSPGGAVDIIARAVAKPLSERLGQPIIVENKPGAGTNIANRALIDSAPDGHTFMLAANAIAANVSLYQPVPYDLVKDITPIAQIGRVPVVIAANAQSEISNLAKLISVSKAKPGTMDFGTPGNGSTPHLAVELFARAAGIELKHVPYKGGAQALNDVIAGHIQTVAVNALEVQPQVKAGKLNVLAVLSPTRTAIFPDAPTIAESGFPGFEASVWYGVIAPAGIPSAITTRLHAEIQRVLALPEIRERLSASGGEVLPGSTAQFANLLSQERTRYEKLIREAKITPN